MHSKCFLLVETSYVHFVPVDDHLGIAHLYRKPKKVQKKVRPISDPVLRRKRLNLFLLNLFLLLLVPHYSTNSFSCG